jgi:secreted trypsin-like serine protease
MLLLVMSEATPPQILQTEKKKIVTTVKPTTTTKHITTTTKTTTKIKPTTKPTTTTTKTITTLKPITKTTPTTTTVKPTTTKTTTHATSSATTITASPTTTTNISTLTTNTPTGTTSTTATHTTASTNTTTSTASATHNTTSTTTPNTTTTCGQYFVNSNIKIVGGVVAVPGSWPSIAYVVWSYTGYYILPTGVEVIVTANLYCDGTLYDTRKILTAAHCIPTTVTFTYEGVIYTGQVILNSYYPTIQSMLAIYLGVQNKSSISNYGNFTAPTVQMSVQTVLINPSWNATTDENDLAILYLTSNVILNKYIQIACLPSAVSTSYPGTSVFAYAAGFGITSNQATAEPDLLNNVKLTVYPYTNCNYIYFIDAQQICAGNTNGGQGICHGDSGGPLYVFDSQSRQVLVGITSFTNSLGCALTGAQGGFTRVSYYLDWINEQTFNSTLSKSNKIVSNFENNSPSPVTDVTTTKQENNSIITKVERINSKENK